VSGDVLTTRLGALPRIGRAVVTLGVFDGVHRGHRAILAAALDLAADEGVPAVALVFDPPPDEVLRPGSRVPRLAPLAVNLARIEATGVDAAVPVRFDDSVRELSAEAFLDELAPAIELDGLTMSSRSAFGRDRGGTAELMRQLGSERGFAVTVVEPVEVAGAPVSSTRIRAAIASGDVAGALELGVAPYLEGIVVVGDRRGRELGFPTAHLRFEYEPAMPAIGIYAGRLTQAGSLVTAGHPALISIGTRPTFHDDAAVQAEVHLLDFDGDLYGVRLGVELFARLREERRFPDADALVVQMRRDDLAARSVLGVS
jgi:riboflavin kinase/FMN adenylyltransferase